MEDWGGRWQEGKTGWRLGNANPVLVKYTDKLLPAKSGAVPRVLGGLPLPALSSASAAVITLFMLCTVPLCGDTKDLKYLADQNAAVVGIELVEEAVLGIPTNIGTPAPGVSMKDTGKLSSTYLHLFCVTYAAVIPAQLR